MDVQNPVNTKDKRINYQPQMVGPIAAINSWIKKNMENSEFPMFTFFLGSTLDTWAPMENQKPYLEAYLLLMEEIRLTS